MSDTPGWHQPDPARDQQPDQPPPMPPPSWQQPMAPRPGVIPLRPLTLTDIIDGAVKTMRGYPAVMLGVAAAVMTITQLIAWPFQWAMSDDLNQIATGQAADPQDVETMLGPMIGGLGITLLILLLARVFLTGFLTAVVGKAVIGRPAPFSGVWAEVKPQLLRLLGLTLIYPLAAVALMIPVVLAAVVSPELAAAVGVVAFLVGIWLLVSFALATPALILERAGVFAALGRSRALVKGSWWRVFGILLLTIIIVWILGSIIQFPFELIGGGTSNLFSTEFAEITAGYLLISSIGVIVASTITEPFAAGVTALLYTDRRIRSEGLDIELARSAESRPPQP